MVGLVRFEVTNTPAQVTVARAVKEYTAMLHVLKSGQNVESFRLELEQADARRRVILTNLFLAHEGEFGPLVSLLMRDARPETLHTLEGLLTAR